MDSVTQLVLGSTVGHAIGSKALGRKAILWGAAIGTLPDLDVIFSPLLNDIEKIVHHRGHSHSFFWQALIAPVIALIIAFIHRQFKHYWCWLLIVLFGFWTHSLIDWFTIYGTKVLLPFDDYPYALGSLFIIDPLFTLPLLIAVIVGLCKPQKSSFAVTALLLCSVYATTAWLVQQKVLSNTQTSLKKQGISHHKIIVNPMPFSILWWRIVAMEKDHWYEGVHILWDDKNNQFTLKQPITFQKHARNTHLLPLLKDSWSLDKLKTFSDNFYQLKKNQFSRRRTDSFQQC